MLGLKNPFIKSPPAPPQLPAPPSAEAALKGAQLLKGRTMAMLQRLTEQVQTAERSLEEARHCVGELVGEEQDATNATQRIKQAQDHLDTMRMALTVARQKDEAAGAELRQARRVVQREELREKLVALADLASTVDRQMHDMGESASQAIRLIRAIQALGHDEMNTKLIDAIKWFRACLLDGCSSMPECETGLDLHKRRLPWSDHLPKPDEADRVK